MRHRFAIAFLLCQALLLFSGCVHTKRADEVAFYLTPERLDSADSADVIRKRVYEINRRNSILKNSPEKLKEAYDGLKIIRMNDLSPEEYMRYRDFVSRDDGRVYIIVHPAYYAFFENDAVLSSRHDAEIFPLRNIVERFCDKRSVYDFDLRLMQEQERMTKDFIEVAAAEQKMIIMVLPFDYRRHFSYGYVNGLDEYVRYLNEVTGGSRSVLYLQSLEFSNGYAGETDLEMISEFLKAAGAKTILLGGEFAGRCLDNFYLSLQRKVNSRMIYIVPEITTLASEDLGDTSSRVFLTGDGTLNYSEISKKIASREDSGRREAPRQIRHLFIYELTDDKLTPIN